MKFKLPTIKTSPENRDHVRTQYLHHRSERLSSQLGHL